MTSINTQTPLAASSHYLFNKNIHSSQKSGVTSTTNKLLDTFERSSNTQNTYNFSRNAPTNAVQSSSMDYSTKDGRMEIGDYYNQVLNELREKYDEPEAMRKFDDFMRSEGYVAVHSDEYNALENTPQIGNAANTGGTSGPIYNGVAIYSDSQSNPFPKLNSTSDKAYQLRSEIRAVWKDGQTEYFAESYGIMNADRSWNEETKQAWRGNSQEIAAKYGIDAESYLDNIPDGDRRKFSGASADLGAMLSNALSEAGIELSESDSIVISYKKDYEGNFTGEVTTGNDNIDRVLNGNKELRDSLNSMRGSNPVSNVSGLPGAYNDPESNRSVNYSQERQLVYSPGQSESVVVTDLANIKASGYAYVKKVSDEFDPECDQFSAFAAEYGPAALMGEGSDGKMYEQLVKDVKDAMASGTKVKGTMPKSQYDAYLDDTYDRFMDSPYGPSEDFADLYEATDYWGEKKAQANIYDELSYVDSDNNTQSVGVNETPDNNKKQGMSRDVIEALKQLKQFATFFVK
jgi:hypothetical protein